MLNSNQSGGIETLTAREIHLVRQHLNEITESHLFAGRKRTQEFLQLIVERALEGDFDSLRERMIGAKMFGRPVGYDTGNDAVVRVKANEVRKRLAQFYAEAEGLRPVRIDIPNGSYVPKFHFELPGGQPEPPSHNPETAVHTPEPPYQTAKAPLPTSSGLATATRIEAPAPHLDAHASNDPQPPEPGKRPSWQIPTASLMALIIMIAIGYLLLTHHNKQQDGGRIRSIAVLPLENLLGDPAQAYFADGMTEELINDLGQVSTLRVISLTSSMSYKGTKKTLPAIARELGVDGVVEGGVLREGKNVRISTQLFDVKEDRLIWSQSYIRDFSSGQAWQGDVAQAIAKEISVKLTPQEQARLARRRPLNPEAEDLYLQGVLKANADDCAAAAKYFDQSIEKDPNYAPVHAALARCFDRMGESGKMDYRLAFYRQKEEAIKAIQLDDSLPEGHAELSTAAMTLDWDWATAERELRRALELNPNSVDIHEKLAFFLSRTGHPQEAVAEVERGVDLDPVYQGSFHSEGFIYYYSRQYDKALDVSQTVHNLDITPVDWSFLLGDVYLEKGMYAQSIAEFSKVGDDPHALGHLGDAYARAGQTAAAKKIIQRLQEHLRSGDVGRYEIALVYAGLGDKEQAFKWLEESYRAHDVGLLFLKIDPCVDPLRSDPRFADLERRVHLIP